MSGVLIPQMYCSVVMRQRRNGNERFLVALERRSFQLKLRKQSRGMPDISHAVRESCQLLRLQPHCVQRHIVRGTDREAAARQGLGEVERSDSNAESTHVGGDRTERIREDAQISALRRQAEGQMFFCVGTQL